MSRSIDEYVKRRLFAESMGHCMNPACRRDLFSRNGDIVEKAHIDPYCKNADNTFENLVVLCPNCHTEFDKNHAFTEQEVLSWKEIRKQEVNQFFETKFPSFPKLRDAVVPLLEENKSIYENYYCGDNKELWDLFEGKILANNKKIEGFLQGNLHLIQDSEKTFSNRNAVQKLLTHIREFEQTRGTKETIRKVLFPQEINSLFGIEPIKTNMVNSTESLEAFLKAMISRDCSVDVHLGIDDPYVTIRGRFRTKQVFLNDAPYVLQLYNDYKCFRMQKVRLESLNFALKYLRTRGIVFSFPINTCVRKISVKHKTILFVYEYCLSKADLMQLAPETDSVIVNLHNWNGAYCISEDAQTLAESMGVTLLSMDDYYQYVKDNLL